MRRALRKGRVFDFVPSNLNYTLRGSNDLFDITLMVIIDHLRNDVTQHTRTRLPDHSWIKLYVKILVDWSGGPLYRL